MMDVIEKSGPVFFALAFCSVIATVVIIERLLNLRRSRVIPKQILDVVEYIGPGKDLAMALDICKRNPGVLSNVLRAGLENADQSWDVMMVTVCWPSAVTATSG